MVSAEISASGIFFANLDKLLKITVHPFSHAANLLITGLYWV